MVEFDLDFTKIAFNDEMILYNKIRLSYKDLALQYKRVFTEQYKEKYTTLEQLCKPSQDDGFFLGANIIKLALDNTIDILVDFGYIDIDVAYFFNNYYNQYYTWEEDFEKVREQYLKIVLNQKMMDEYRAQRRLNRGRLVGGGFGVKGAAKGILMAEAGNIALGGAHMIANGIGKWISESIDQSKMNKIFRNPQILIFLSDSIEKCIFNIHFALVKFIMDKSIKPISIVLGDDIRRSINIYNNLKEKLSTKEEFIEKLFKKIIIINPYFEPMYFTYIDKFGDENKQIEIIGTFFGIDIKNYKFTLLNDFYQSSLSKCLDEKACVILKRKINQMIQKLGYEQYKFDTQLLDDKIQEYDRIARTYQGFLLESREEVPKAKEEYKKIMNIINSHPTRSREDFLLIIDQIKGQYETTIGDKIINELELQSRTLNGIVYDTFDEAMLAEIKEFYKSCLPDCLDEESCIILKEEINQMIQKLGYEQYKFDTQLLDNKIQKFDRIARTYQGILFESREEAQKAKEEYKKIMNIINNHPTLSIEDFLLIIDEIKGQYETTIGDKIITELENQSRTVNGVVYETFDEAFLAETKDFYDSSLSKCLDEESCIMLKIEINQRIQKFHKPFNLDTQVLDEKIQEFDRVARTYEGILFESREEVQKAKEEYKKLMNIINNHPTRSIEDFLLIIDEIKGQYETFIGDKIITELENQSRTVNGVVYETFDEAFLAETKDFYDSSLSKCIDEESCIMLKIKINQRIQKFHKPFNFDTQVLDEKIQEFDRVARTYEGILFESREEVQKAKEEYKKLMNIINNHPTRSIEDFLLIIDEIKGQYETTIGDKIINELELQSRTLNGIVYDTFDDAMLAKKTLKIINLNSLDSIKQCIDELEKKDILNTKLINYLKLVYQEYQTAEKQFQDNITLLDNINELRKYRELIQSQTYLVSLKDSHLQQIDSKIHLLEKEIVRKRAFYSFIYLLLAILVLIGCLIIFKIIPETTTEMPAETTMEMPAETTTEIPAETTMEMPAETTTEIPAETTTEIPAETITEIPAETTTEIPAETTTETKESLKLVEFGEVVGEVTILDDEHLLVENDENLSIYDGDLNLIKDLGNISLYTDRLFDGTSEGTFEGGFVYSEPYFYNGYMQEKIGLMDNNGNVLYKAYYFSSDGEYAECDEHGVCLNERISNEMIQVIYSSMKLREGTVSLVQGLNGLGLSIVETYSDGSFEEIQTLVPANYEELLLEENTTYYLSGNESFMYTELDGHFDDRQSIGFKRNGQYGIVDFEGHEILEANYGGMEHLTYNEEEDQDYYLVIESSGKAGIFTSRTGWVIEPILSYQDEIEMVNSHIVVKPHSSNVTRVYNNLGELLVTYDDLVDISAIQDWSGENKTSNQFYTVSIEETYSISSSGLYNSDFKECFKVPSKITEDSSYYRYSTISDKVLIVSYWLNSSTLAIYIFEIDGNLIGSFSLTDSEMGYNFDEDDIIVFNERFMIAGTKVYEIEGL